jgi:hypothetical protein
MYTRKVRFLNSKTTNIVVAGLLITALVGKNLLADSLQVLSGPRYHHVHHGDDNSNTPKHEHCHAHGPQIIDTTILSYDIYYIYKNSVIRNINNYFTYDKIKRSAMSSKVFRPPIVA